MSVLCHGHLPLLHYLLSTIAVYEPPAPYATTSTLFNLEASTLVLETLPSAAMLYASCEGIFPAIETLAWYCGSAEGEMAR